jgi:hypothetical protein
MVFHEKIKEIIHLIDNWLTPPSTEEEIGEWVDTAEKLIDTYELSEYEQRYTNTMLSYYEEQFTYMIQQQTSPSVLKEEMDELLSRKQTEQRTDVWYKQMNTIISASELHNLFGSDYQRSKFVLSKSSVSQPRAQQLAVPSGQMTAFDWGIRFEPVVKLIYEHKYGAVIKELGRMIHPIDPRCAASPDGLIYDASVYDKIGHLIEIKCPVTREIDGTIPKDYYHQMQLQLHVTGLHICEYIEASFSSAYNESVMDVSIADTTEYHGVIALIRYAHVHAGQDFYYRYSPVNCSREWIPMIDAEEELIELIPWTLRKWNEKTVYKSEEWWKTTYVRMEEFWRDVEKCKRGEFTVLESKRPVKKQKQEEKCMITFTRLELDQ